jgi:hypothetical protein
LNSRCASQSPVPMHPQLVGLLGLVRRVGYALAQ